MNINHGRRALLKYGVAGLASTCLMDPTQWVSRGKPSKQNSKKQVRFGLNYVPRKNWWFIWHDWDAQSIADDFRAIADLGMDHIRIQCLWPFFQPGIGYVSSLAVHRLHELLDLADAFELDVEVAVLDGWLSGLAFLPAWVSPASKHQNIFTTPEVIAAEQFLFLKLTESVGEHKRFLGFDLGNEINSLLGTVGFGAKRSELDHWATTMLGAVERMAPGKLHVNSADGPWFDDSSFSRQNLATRGAATVVHCYAYWSGALEYYRYNDVGSLHLLEFLLELAKAFQTDTKRLVWVQEVGASAEWMPEGYIPEYASVLLRNAASCGGIWGFTWWCSHDIDPRMKGFSNLEYGLGVFDQRNRVKPIGRLLAKIAKELRHSPIESPNRPLGLVIPDNHFVGSGENPVWSVGQTFMRLIAAGKQPAIVLASRTKDEDYLRGRGIKDLVKPAYS